MKPFAARAAMARCAAVGCLAPLLVVFRVRLEVAPQQLLPLGGRLAQLVQKVGVVRLPVERVPVPPFRIRVARLVAERRQLAHQVQRDLPAGGNPGCP